MNNTPKEWEEKKVEYMKLVMQLKYEQHEDLRHILINTGLRPLIKCSFDSFWGDGGNGKGQNILGKILMSIREKFLIEFYSH
jgi:ribA/ribD-fused uncharacterized protein